MSRTLRLGTLAVAVAAIAASVALTVAAAPSPAASPEAAPIPPLGSDPRVALHDEMRKLWEDHILWTRQFVVSAATLADDLPDLTPTTDRLLANQDDIGDALRPFYGDEAGDAVTALLREHILGAAALVTAAKAGDTDAVTAATTEWYANADQIAAALHGLNEAHWDQAHLAMMMKAHLDRTLEEAVARLEGRYVDDIAAYEAIHADILAMADMFSDGIIAQFPDRFTD